MVKKKAAILSPKSVGKSERKKKKKKDKEKLEQQQPQSMMSLMSTESKEKRKKKTIQDSKEKKKKKKKTASSKHKQRDVDLEATNGHAHQISTSPQSAPLHAEATAGQDTAGYDATKAEASGHSLTRRIPGTGEDTADSLPLEDSPQHHQHNQP